MICSILKGYFENDSKNVREIIEWVNKKIKRVEKFETFFFLLIYPSIKLWIRSIIEES